jgi:hypothetical protein
MDWNPFFNTYITGNNCIEQAKKTSDNASLIGITGTHKFLSPFTEDAFEFTREFAQERKVESGVK